MCSFPVSREFCLGDRFATDCLVSQRVLSLGCYFPVGENRRHSRRLGWGAPVSGPQFLAFRLLRGGFLAPVSGGDFPISVSGVQRSGRQQTVLMWFSGLFWAQSLTGRFWGPVSGGCFRISGIFAPPRLRPVRNERRLGSHGPWWWLVPPKAVFNGGRRAETPAAD